jgi:hypothetical protein
MSGRDFSTRATLQAAAGAIGDGTPMDVTGLASLGLAVAGTFVGTVRFETSLNGLEWSALPVLDVPNEATVDYTTGEGLYQAEVAGCSLVRARVSAFTSGSITVTALGTTAPG